MLTYARSLACVAIRRSFPKHQIRALSSGSITYSGGQASEGQGGFYGSGGARSLPGDSQKKAEGDDARPVLLALAADVEKISNVMKEYYDLEAQLEEETESTSSRSIEIKASIKKLMTHPEVLDSLNRLEVQGQPVWGLSASEREMIIEMREKANDC